jgi:hypothetical protein
MAISTTAQSNDLWSVKQMSWKCPQCGAVNDDLHSGCITPACHGDKGQSDRQEAANLDCKAKLQSLLDERSKKIREGFWVRSIFTFAIVFFLGLLVFMGIAHGHGKFWPGFLVVIFISSVIGLMAGFFGDEAKINSGLCK